MKEGLRKEGVPGATRKGLGSTVHPMLGAAHGKLLPARGRKTAGQRSKGNREGGLQGWGHGAI